MAENKPTNSELWSRAKSAARKKFDVYPSAYANAWAAKWYREKGGTWRKAADGGFIDADNKRVDPEEYAEGGLTKWFEQKWVDLGRPKKGGGYEDCGREDAESGNYPKCVPAAKAASMSESQKKSAVARKRAAESDGKGGKPTNVPTFAKKMAEGGEVTITPEDMNLIRRRSREFGELTPLAEPTRKKRKDGADITGLGQDLEEAYGRSDRGRASEFFDEGYQLESRAEPTVEGGQTFEFDNNSGIDFSSIMGQADGGMIGSMANIASAIGKQQESPFPQVTEIGMPMENMPSAKLKDVQKMAKGGYVVVRSSERKGKTHKVTGPDGSVKFFGDPNLKNKPNDPKAKASWYARHAKSLKANPHYRAYARETWADGGMVPDDDIEYFQEGGISGEGELPLPPDLEEAPAASVDVSKLSEEEKKKIIERQRADAEASGVPFTAQSPVTPAPAATAPASPVTVVVAQPEKAAAEPAEETSTGVEGDPKVVREPPSTFTTKNLLGYYNRREGEGGVLTAEQQERKKQAEKESEPKFQEVRQRALREMGGLTEPLEDTPENAERNAEIERRNAYRSEAASRIANEVTTGATARPVVSQTPAVEAKPAAPPEATKEAAAAPTLPAAAAGTTIITPPAPAETPKPAVPTPVAAIETAAITERDQPSGIGLLTKGEVADARQSGYYPLLVKTGIQSAGLTQVEAENAAIETIAKTQKARSLEALGAPTAAQAEAQARATPEFIALQQALAQEDAAVRETARLEAAKNNAVAAIKTAENDLNQKIVQDYETRKRALDSERNFIRQSILDKTVDPNRYITGASKMGLGIAALLSVVGKGLGAKSAGVSDFIEKQIERDIDLQIKDIDKRKTVLGELVRAGNDLDDALRLTTAYYKNIFSAQVEMAALPFTNEIAKQEALKLSGKLQMDAAKLQDEVLKNAMERIYKPYKDRLSAANNTVIDLAEYARLIQQRKLAGDKAAGAAKKVADTAAAKAAKGAKTAEEQALFSGQSLNTGQYAKLPNQIKKEFAVREVNETGRPTGNFVAATDPTAKKGIQEVDTDAQKILDTLTELDSIAAKYNYTGIGTIAGVGVTEARRADLARAEKLQKDLAAFMGGKSQYNVGVPSDNEYKRLVEAIPNATSYGSNAFGKAKFDQFRKDVIAAQRRMRSFGLVAPPTGGATKAFTEETATPIRE